MGIEIERKFLVDGDLFNEAYNKSTHPNVPLRICQGYVMEDEDTNTVLRVRLYADYDGMAQPKFGKITLKRGIDSMSRHEFEYDIPGDDADFILRNMCKTAIHKIRRTIPYSDSSPLEWEVDSFINPEYDDLILAEIELPSPDTEIVLPPWIIKEVTDDPQYLNSNLIKRINT